MTRQIVLDTETTGLNPRLGNRVIEIGCVELINRKLTGNNFHCYINPERDSEAADPTIRASTAVWLAGGHVNWPVFRLLLALGVALVPSLRLT